MKIYGGFNKCPKCGAIKRSKSVKKTYDLCSSCQKKQEEKEIDIEASLLLTLSCIKNVRFFLALKPKDLTKAEIFLKTAVKDLEEIINLIQP